MSSNARILTPEEVEKRRLRHASHVKKWALNNPDQYREIMRKASLAYYYANKAKLNLKRAELTRQNNARKKEAKIAAAAALALNI